MRGIKTLKVARNTLATGTVIESVEGELELVSSGIPDIEIDVAIVDPLTNFRCSPGEVGEIWVAGETVADGYWNRRDATADTFAARLAGSANNWLRTGDLGALVDGEIYVTGRIKDLIVIRGHNHYPQDIEATVQLAHEAVKAHGVAAFALDTEDGESIGLVIELERGKFQGDTREIEAAIRNAISLAHQLTPASINFVKANRIPKTSSGKIQRLLARDMLLDGRFAQVSLEQADTEEV
jgi:acyl-CoA synthetase (AMP-forming)/AMP-acid ligase II